MDQSIKENGAKRNLRNTVRVFRSGQMAPCIKGNGKMTRRMVGGDSFMQRGIPTRENGSMIMPMAKEFINLSMEHNTTESGRTMIKTEKVLRFGLMEQNTMEITLTA